MILSSKTAIWVRSPAWRTNIWRSTFSRRARNSDSVITVPRRRTKSRGSRSRRLPRSLRSLRLRPRSRDLVGPSSRVRGSRAGRASRGGRTFTTVTTPSSSITSPGVTPSPLARRRRRRRGVELELSSLSSSFNAPASRVSSVSESLSVEFSSPSRPPRRRPLPPRRRRRRSALSSLVSEESSEACASLFAGLAFFGATSSGAAWNIGTGIEAARLLLLLSVSTTSGVESETLSSTEALDSVLCVSACESALADFFLDMRLRAPFGAIAIKSNPHLKLILKLPFESSGTRCESAFRPRAEYWISITYNGNKGQLLRKICEKMAI